ncbi:MULTISPECIES: Smr/MutS family protein [Hymenobacter]|uniref:Smr/MutS family protein n=1 Tax=Hymenobacter jejuensis TaxID=2502781 RepID=A0A5B7ZUQ0_9BACT|nr:MULTISPECIES: Smr/MutS family protein [Hymenobacter]MBC6989093.1 Smr/MutS family protein [Hymenobacter sp. BT491]QDA58698.1 Smr/MutS family protein [Hymenobacter jejuensis]
MNVGDRVRLLTGREEGIITRLLDNDLVEVAIDNDFTIPVMRREVVVVAAEEQKAFGQSASAVAAEKKAAASGAPKTAPAPQKKQEANATPEPPRPAPVAAAKGLYLALVHQSPELLALQLINNTESDVLFTYGEDQQEQYRGLASDKLGPKAVSRPLAHLHLKDFDHWPTVVVQLLPHQVNGHTAYELITKRTQFRAATFYKSRQEAPVLKRDAYLFQLDEKPAAPVAIAPEALASQLQQQLSGNAPAKPAAIAPAPEPAKAITAPPHEVDLHLEALRPDAASEEPALTNTAMLKIQLDAFEDALSRALATNMHEIVFIHGTGNGTLRKEIHKQLSRNRDIKFFEDARKEKFGYGATLVRLK